MSPHSAGQRSRSAEKGECGVAKLQQSPIEKQWILVRRGLHLQTSTDHLNAINGRAGDKLTIKRKRSDYLWQVGQMTPFCCGGGDVEITIAGKHVTADGRAGTHGRSRLRFAVRCSVSRVRDYAIVLAHNALCYFSKPGVSGIEPCHSSHVHFLSRCDTAVSLAPSVHDHWRPVLIGVRPEGVMCLCGIQQYRHRSLTVRFRTFDFLSQPAELSCSLFGSICSTPGPSRVTSEQQKQTPHLSEQLSSCVLRRSSLRVVSLQ